MNDQPPKLKVRSKVWLVDEDGRMILGLGRVKMLETIHRLGSINAAAKELRMSTRAIYGRIKTTEEHLGRPLLVRNVGGAAGGGSKLTDYAVFLLDCFGQLNRDVEKEADRLFNETFTQKTNPDAS